MGVRRQVGRLQLLVEADHGAVRLRSHLGRDVTASIRNCGHLRRISAPDPRGALLAGRRKLSNYLAVQMQNQGRDTRVEFWAFDLLYLDDARC